VVHPPGFKPGA